MNTDRIRFLVIHSTFAFALLALLLGVCAQKSLAQGESFSRGHSRAVTGAVYAGTNDAMPALTRFLHSG